MTCPGSQKTTQRSLDSRGTSCLLAISKRACQSPRCEGTSSEMSELNGKAGVTEFAVDDRRLSTMSNGQVHIAPRTRSLTGVQVLGSGSYVPDNVVSNVDLQDSHGFDPEWIVNRTGIHERRFALPHQATSDLCTQAAIRCLKAADCHPANVDLLVLATFTPD